MMMKLLLFLCFLFSFLLTPFEVNDLTDLIRTTTVAETETTTVAETETTTVAETETTTVAATETTTVDPTVITTVAPIETTTVAPTEADIVPTLAGRVEQSFVVDLGNGNSFPITLVVDYDFIKVVYNDLNQFREANGISTLRMDKAAIDVAILRAAENAALTIANGTIEVVTHTRPNGLSFGSLGEIHENLIAGRKDNVPQHDVLNMFAGSASHCNTMLSLDSTKVGIGCVEFLLPVTGETLVIIIESYFS